MQLYIRCKYKSTIISSAITMSDWYITMLVDVEVFMHSDRDQEYVRLEEEAGHK